MKSFLNKSKVKNEDSQQNIQTPIQNSVSNSLLNQSTIRYISNANPIEVTPPEIFFRDIQINQTYEIIVYVRNLTKTARRIRVFQPKTSKFRCDYEMLGAIAAGLAMKLVVSFESNQLSECHDILRIVSDENYSVEVPLHAYPLSSQVIFEPFINMGFIRVNKEKIDYVYFRNEGKTTGKVELKLDQIQDLNVEPSSFSLAPQRETRVKLIFRPREAGIFRGSIEVFIEGEGQQFQKQIDVNATSVDYNRFIIDEAGMQTNEIDFGSMYYGQFKEVEVYLVNNTPQKYKFSTKIRMGQHINEKNLQTTQTPNEIGYELTEKVMSCYPQQGVLNSYSQFALKFRCKSKVQDKHQIWTSQYSINKLDVANYIEDYIYSMIIEYCGAQDTQEDPTVIILKGKGQCPSIKLSKSLMQYGECPMYDHRDMYFDIINKNEEIPIDFKFERKSYFQVTPEQGTLPASMTNKCIARFQPRNLGTFNMEMNLLILDGAYRIPIKFLGTSSTIVEKKRDFKRGIECVPEDFEYERTFVEDGKFEVHQKQKSKRSIIYGGSTTEKSLLQQLGSMGDVSSLKQEELLSKFQDKSNFKDYVRIQRQERVQKEKQRKIKENLVQMQEKLRNLGIIEDKKTDEENGRGSPPVDYEFLFGMGKKGIDSPRLPLPESKDQLFVEKPIDQYEPKIQRKQDFFKHKSTDPVGKLWPSEPKSHAEIRDCLTELSGEQLQKIFADPKVIDFGNIFVMSTAKRTFAVKNGLRTPIMVRLQYTDKELDGTNTKPQIIPSSQKGIFEVSVTSDFLNQFKSYVRYIVNDKHTFNFEVHAQIKPVKLELSTHSLKLSFSDDNMEQITSEKVTIRNNGNADARFKFILGEQKLFTVDPIQGVVPTKGSKQVIVSYLPSQSNSNLLRGEEEKLIMKVENGNDVHLKCIGYSSEGKVVFKDSQLDLKEISVGAKEEKTIVLKNQNKHPAIFKILESELPNYIDINPLAGRINGDSFFTLKVNVSVAEEKILDDHIQVYIRGGKPIKLPIIGNVIKPKVRIIESEFDFGGITTLGVSQIKQMTIINESNIEAKLNLDLREIDSDQDSQEEDDEIGYDCLQVSLNKELSGVDDVESVMEGMITDDEQEYKQDKQEEKSDSEDQEDKSEESEEDQQEDQEKHAKRNFQITLKPHKQLTFNMTFSPKDVREYEFDIPLYLTGVGSLPSLTRKLRAEGLNPKLLVNPQNIEFKKKIIQLLAEKSQASSLTLTLSNPGTQPLSWYLDTENTIDIEKIFSIEPNKNTIPPGGTQEISVNFHPYQDGIFEKRVPLYLKDDESGMPYLEINIKGQGSYAKLRFDRREVLLPVVPLGIVSKSLFRIINDGYENLNLKHNFSQEPFPINLQINYIDGKNLGVTKNKIKIELTFSHIKTLSFTRSLDFYDDNNRTYSIFVSGTTDNCLLTNFTYMFRCPEEYKLLCVENQPIKIIEELHDSDAGSEQGDLYQPSPINFGGMRNESMNNSTKSNSKSLLGYSPLPNNIVIKTLQSIKNWLNTFGLQIIIEDYPEDVIQSQGAQLYELLQNLLGKMPNLYKAKYDKNTKRADKVHQILKQYESLIKYMQENGGAQLNTIRPYHLLSYSDYIFYLKSENDDQISNQYLKLLERRFNYVSREAWITLFYQIIKCYYLQRITLKAMKILPPGMHHETNNSFETIIDQSTLYSSTEYLLIKWMELHYENANPLQKKMIRTFDVDLRDCRCFAAVIQNYVGTQQIKQMLNLKLSCQTDEDYKFNAEKIVKSLDDIGIYNTLSVKDLVYPTPVDNLLFTMQLFFSLPNYLPKREPIIFQCVLGEEVSKNIELTNPTQSNISYYVKLDQHGTNDFSIEDNEIRLEAKMTRKFTIKFQSRISQSVSARVIFTNKREGNVQAAALVFDLKSNIVERKSMEILQTKAKLYQAEDIRIPVKNFFVNSSQEWGDFSISIINQKPRIFQQSPKKTKKNQNGKKTLKKKGEKHENEEENKSPLMDLKQFPSYDDGIVPAFFCIKERIRIRKGDTQSIIIQFLPFVLDSHKCYVIFCDNNVGEFQYEIHGETLLPDPMKEIKPNFTIYVDSNKEINHQLTFKNENLQQALKTHENRLTLCGRVRERELFLRLVKNAPQPESAQLDCEMQPFSHFIQFPGVITLQNNSKITRKKSVLQNLGDNPTTEVSVHEESSDQNLLKLFVNFRTPIQLYQSQIILKNKEKTDVRIFRIAFSVSPKVVRIKLEMTCPAGEKIKQEIPIINNDDRDWMVKAVFQHDSNPNKNSQFFSGQRELYIGKKKTGNYVLQFRPTFMATAESKLILTNPVSNHVFEYELIGKGEEPLAKEHIVMNCVARKPYKREIEIENPYKDKAVQYIVETDLINPEGPPSFSIQPGKKYKYPLIVTPLLGGIYTGSINFIENDDRNKYIWYTICLNTDKPKSEQRISLNANLRKAVAFEISLSNPLNDPIVFDVNIEGEGLMGEHQFAILPGQTSTYEAIFSPLRVFKGKGQIAFMNDKLGEIWYELNLSAEDNPVQRLPTLKAELGKSQAHVLDLENPSKMEVKVNTSISNLQNFSVIPENITIPPFESKQVKVLYTPTDLDVSESGEIIFETEEIGSWRYIIYGMGLPPTEFETKVVKCTLNNDKSSVINFKNPFKDAITVFVSMDTDERNQQAFQLLLKKNKTTIPGLTVFQIPFSFIAKEITVFEAHIQIFMSEKIQWKFPIKGITEYISTTTSFNFKTKARNLLETQLEVQLPGIPQDLDSQGTFELELDEIPQEYQNLLNRSFKLTPLKRTLTNHQDFLLYGIKFEPLKPFKASIDLIIVNQQGGRWKFKLHLEASEPEVDDNIVIYSPLNKTSSVSFKLNNKFKYFAPFKAFFTPDSDPEFSIIPNTGDLDPIGREGKTFIISFTPVEYGKTKNGKLIIQTDELYWSFAVKGTFPQYNPPKGEKFITTKLEPHLKLKKQEKSQKNFLLQNIRKNKESPLKKKDISLLSNQKERS